MPTYKRPIKQSLIIGCAGFVMLLCVILSVMSYFMVSRSLYSVYEKRLADVIGYIEPRIDKKDLKKCIETGEKSPEYDKLQGLLNDLIDNFGLEYLYIVIPSDEGEGSMTNVVSATNQRERDAGEEDLPLLYQTNAYPKKELQRYLKAWKPDKITYFEETSDYGTFYTACRPLKSEKGKTFALLCADIPIGDLHANVGTYVIYSVIVIIAVGAVFAVILILWLNSNVIGPVLALANSARTYAEKNTDVKDPDLLTFYAPEIHTENEVEMLARAMTKMSEDMKKYVREIVSAEQRADEAEKEAEGLSKLAYQDPLTHVKSLRAYEEFKDETDRAIADGDNICFGVVMVDLDQLKQINDTYGHDKGNEYIIGTCNIVCSIFKHSPVYRIGGDEFVVVLTGEDYVSRHTLFSSLFEKLNESKDDIECSPWERYSASAGMSEYRRGIDGSVDDVFKRADEDMYNNKKH